MHNLLISKLFRSFCAGAIDGASGLSKIAQRVDVTSGDLRNKFYDYLIKNYVTEADAERLANQYSDPAMHMQPSNPRIQREAYLNFSQGLPLMAKDPNTGEVFQSVSAYIPGLKGALPNFEINNKGFIQPENQQQKKEIRSNVITQMGAAANQGAQGGSGIGTAGAMGLGALGAGLLAGGGYYLYNKWKNRNRDDFDDGYEFDEDEVEDYYSRRR